jgi:acetyltransferase-like isoleucine patch superfamily enzyme
MVGPGCYITDSDHGMKLGVPVKDQPMVKGEVVIEDEAWIGAHACILKNVKIGRGAIVAAGAVVTKNVEANEIAKGVPAQKTGKRD